MVLGVGVGVAINRGVGVGVMVGVGVNVGVAVGFSVGENVGVGLEVGICVVVGFCINNPSFLCVRSSSNSLIELSNSLRILVAGEFWDKPK